MKKIYTILLSVLCLTAVVSCDDFLDRKPSNSIDSATSIKTKADAELAINGIVREMLSSNFYGSILALYGDARGGDFAVPSNGNGYDYLFNYSITANSGTCFGFWQTGFSAIAMINTTIEAVKNIGKTDEDFGDILGQLYTYRGMIYFDLCKLYGRDYMQNKAALAVPIQTTQSIDAVSKRETVEKVYAQALGDLQEGAKTIGKKRNNGFINYYGNLVYQARMYMHMQDYPTALKICEEIINDGPYTLYKNNEWEASWAKRWASESIIEFAVVNGEAEPTPATYIIARKDKVYPSAIGPFVASDYWLDRMNEDPDDIRWSVMDDDTILSEIGGTRKGSCYKMVGGLARKGDGESSALLCNIKHARLSEVYLIAAEAAFKVGGADNMKKAADYLGAISKRSPNLATPTASTVTLDWILSEKSKELFGEGSRFWDMVRQSSYDAKYKTLTYNDAIDGISETPTKGGRDHTIDLTTFEKVILPIAESEIRKAGKDVLIQNPGY